MKRAKSDYALLWANGSTFGEIYDLIRADILGPHQFEVGESVAYDDDQGEVLERIPSTRPCSDGYRVRWTDGAITIEWGSDLVRV